MSGAGSAADPVGLRHSYSLLAPLYDPLVGRASTAMRRASLAHLSAEEGPVLLCGVGTGLDIPWLPRGPYYVGVDLTPAMLRRCRKRAQAADLAVGLAVGDAMVLPFRDAAFGQVVLHLILAVVARPEAALREAERVLRPGGSLLVLDKFLRPGQRAPLRRALNPLLRRLATRTDVVFEPLLAAAPGLRLLDDEPALPGGWFRRLRLRKGHP